MGCSSSAIAPGTEVKANDVKPKNDLAPLKENSPNHGHQNGHLKISQANGLQRNHAKDQNVDKNANKLDPLDQTPVPKSVAFEVTLDGQTGDGLLKFKKRPPRLQTLEPLNVPTLTADQLAEKQRLADEKRQRIKQKKLNSVQKSSKRRRELIKAREFGMKQQLEEEKNVIDDTLKQAELKREHRLMEIKEKQKMREERAKRIREKAKRLQNPDEEVEVEKDVEFNATSDDSWLSNQDQNHMGEQEDEEPKKRVGQIRPTVSASTVDSYDAAFMRHGTQPLDNQNSKTNGDLEDDDFFGS